MFPITPYSTVGLFLVSRNTLLKRGHPHAEYNPISKNLGLVNAYKKRGKIHTNSVMSTKIKNCKPRKKGGMKRTHDNHDNMELEDW